MRPFHQMIITNDENMCLTSVFGDEQLKRFQIATEMDWSYDNFRYFMHTIFFMNISPLFTEHFMLGGHLSRENTCSVCQCLKRLKMSGYTNIFSVFFLFLEVSNDLVNSMP